MPRRCKSKFDVFAMPVSGRGWWEKIGNEKFNDKVKGSLFLTFAGILMTVNNDLRLTVLLQ